MNTNNQEALSYRIGDLVLYKNNQLIAFNKPNGIGVQEDKTADKSLLQIGKIYCKSELYITHRIDRPASGIVLFAKTINGLRSINEQFRERTISKTYLAVVKNEPPKPADSLVHFLKKQGGKNKVVAVDESHKDAKKAILEYKVIGQSDNYHFLEITLLSGRHHQIRAQLSAINCPIKGDVKYGARRGNKDRSIHLHAWKLGFTHPTSFEKVTLEAPLPEDPVWNVLAEQLKKK